MILTEERKKRGWSRAELARRAKMNAATVGLIESERFIPYASQLEKLARALRWPVGEAPSLLRGERDESECRGGDARTTRAAPHDSSVVEIVSNTGV